MYLILKENYYNLYDIKDGDYYVWKNNIKNAKNINTYIMKKDNKVIGYIQYIVEKDTVCISEIQILKQYQSDGKTFRKLIRNFIILSNIIDNIIVYGYINPKNNKSKEVFTKIGFKNIKENRYEILGKYLIEKFL